MLAILYKLGSPFHGSPEEKEEYEKDMRHNLKLIREIPVEEEEKIVEFVQKTDNRKILQELQNEALIFNGKKDLFMSAQMGEGGIVY